MKEKVYEVPVLPKPILILLALSTISVGAHLLTLQSLLDVLGFPSTPVLNSCLIPIVPPGPMLERLEKEVGDSLPVSSIKEVDIATYLIDSTVEGIDVLKFYSPAFDSKKWKTLVSSVARAGDVTVILTQEKAGMLIVDVDPPGQDRDLNFILVSGR